MKCHVNGVSLFYEKSGTGAPLLLLHGNGQTHAIFDRAIPLLSRYFTVYAIDSRGHGQSSPVTEYRYMDMADDVKLLIEHLQLRHPVVYGLSDGAIIGLLLACHSPHALSQLIISGANTEVFGIRDGWRRVFQWINRIVKEPKMDMMLKPPGITKEMLQKIAVPTTVLAGSRDMVKESHTAYIAQNIKNSKLHILPGEGHGSYVVHSTKIGKLIIEAVRP